jgi:hypothetical protein
MRPKNSDGLGVLAAGIGAGNGGENGADNGTAR